MNYQCIYLLHKNTINSKLAHPHAFTDNIYPHFIMNHAVIMYMLLLWKNDIWEIMNKGGQFLNLLYSSSLHSYILWGLMHYDIFCEICWNKMPQTKCIEGWSLQTQVCSRRMSENVYHIQVITGMQWVKEQLVI